MNNKSLILIFIIVAVAGFIYWKSRKKEETAPEMADHVTYDTEGASAFNGVPELDGDEEEYQKLRQDYYDIVHSYPSSKLSLQNLREAVENVKRKNEALEAYTKIKGVDSLTVDEEKKLSTSQIERMVLDASEKQKQAWETRKKELENLVTQTRNWLQAKHKDGAKINDKQNNKSMFEKYVKEATNLNNDAERVYYIKTFDKGGKVTANVYKYGDAKKMKDFNTLYDACKNVEGNIAKKFTDEKSLCKSLMTLYTSVKNSGKTLADINEFGTLNGSI